MNMPSTSSEYTSVCASAIVVSVTMRMSSAMRPSGLSCSPAVNSSR